MTPVPSLPLSLAARKAVYAGLGFALGVGWLWFPAMQETWLPSFLSITKFPDTPSFSPEYPETSLP